MTEAAAGAVELLSSPRGGDAESCRNAAPPGGRSWPAHRAAVRNYSGRGPRARPDLVLAWGRSGSCSRD
eukprot:530357-Alexandrium_andersonii.AAC.1